MMRRSDKPLTHKWCLFFSKGEWFGCKSDTDLICLANTQSLTGVSFISNNSRFSLNLLEELNNPKFIQLDELGLRTELDVVNGRSRKIPFLIIQTPEAYHYIFGYSDKVILTDNKNFYREDWQ